MIGLEEMRAASKDASIDFAQAAGIDYDALRALSLAKSHEVYLQLILTGLQDLRSLDLAVISAMSGAWAQAFAAGVLAARVEGAPE